jgi:2-C-methyl-D-erythritol 2,4-cyclodiphosphate synthase
MICAIGQDSHRFDPRDKEKKLILGGAVIENHQPLSANSDGDVVLHALTNAISGLSGVNILGKIADEMCKNGITNSDAFVKEALKYLNGRITHVSFTIECKTPYITPHIEKMREFIGTLLDLPPKSVGITATSGEELTDFGRDLGISVFCIATAEVK